MSINRVILTGNLTRDAELRSTSTGMSILNVGIAVNDRKKNSSTGEWEEVPNFFDLVFFGTRAEGLEKHLTKGLKVGVEGKLRWSSWETDGQKRSKVEIIVDNLEFLSKREGGGDFSQNAASPKEHTSTAQPPIADVSVYDEDIPF